MIKDITIGQFFPGKSFLHKLDPRMKIVLTLTFIIYVFLAKNFYSLGLILLLVIGLVIISKISIKVILKSLRMIAILVIFTSALNIFYVHTGTSLVGNEDTFIHITTGGIYTAIFFAIRIICLVVVSSMLTYTTSPTMLTDAIERLLSPLNVFKIEVHSIAMMMTIALRFIPILIDEIDRIMNAQKARGADMESGNIFRRIKAMIPVLIPLFISAIRRAYDLAFAMEARSYRGGEGRTRMKQLKLQKRDYFALGIMVLVLAGMIALNVLFGSVL